MTLGRWTVVAGTAIGLGWLASGLDSVALTTQREPPVQLKSPRSPSGTAVSGGLPDRSLRPHHHTSDRVEEFERWFRSRSSLRNAEMDGSWSALDPSGKLIPNRALRYRFDQLLLLQGETDLNEIAEYIDSASRLSFGQQGADQVSLVWRKYLALLARNYENHIQLNQPASWHRALEERKAARRDLLGPEWAEHFFGEEERQLEQLVQKVTQSKS